MTEISSGLRCKSPASPHGFKDATTDAEQVRRLWQHYPGGLIGVPTGEVSGFDVLDLDTAKHPEAICWWMSHRNRIPLTRTHQTGNGGLHLLFKHHALARTGNARIGPGIDVKANGGYIVWWVAYGRKLVHDAAISEWPDWLIGLQQPKISQRAAVQRVGNQQNLEGVFNFVSSLKEGERNVGAFWGFCRAFEAVSEGVVGENEAVDLITEAALHTGLDENEVRGIARSARNAAGRK